MALATRPLATMADVLAGADDAPALLCASGGPAYSRAQLRGLAARFAASLRASGVKPGDVVTIAEPNTVGGWTAEGGRLGGEGADAECGLRRGLSASPPPLVGAPFISPAAHALLLPLTHPLPTGRVRGGLHRRHARPRRGRAAQPKLPDGARVCVCGAGQGLVGGPAGRLAGQPSLQPARRLRNRAAA